MKFPPYPRYKDSGIDWLGEIPAHWKPIRLKHLLKEPLMYGANESSESEDITLPRFVRITDIKDDGTLRDDTFKSLPYEVAKPYLLEGGDVLFARSGATVGKSVIYDSSWGVACFAGYLIRARLNIKKVAANFFSFCCQSDFYWDYISGSLIQATIQNVSAEKYVNLFLPFPPIEEQKAIAEFLYTETLKVDELIGKQKRLIALLQEKRQVLIYHVVTNGLNPNVPRKDSGVTWIGGIPEHWEVLRNKVIFRETDEKSLSGEEELLTVSHITGVTPRSEKEVNMFLAESLEGYKKCKRGDLIINTMWAFMGALGLTDYDGVVSPSYNVYRLRNQGKVYPKYLDHLYRTPNHITEILRYSKGIWDSRLRLYPDAFLSMRVALPPYEEQKAIVEYLDRETTNIDALMEKARRAIELLQEHRTALISSAVTGKIDVRQAAMAGNN